MFSFASTVLTVLAVVAIPAAVRGAFVINHSELSGLVFAVENQSPPASGKALVAHFSPDVQTGALVFKENADGFIVTVDGEFCVTDDNGIRLTQCQAGQEYYRVNYLASGRAKGIVRGRDEATMTMIGYGNKSAVMSHQDDPLVSLPFAANKNAMATYFAPE